MRIRLALAAALALAALSAAADQVVTHSFASSVPPGVDVTLETHYGEVDLDGTFGNVECDLTAGEIHVRTPRANVRDLSASVRIGEVHANLGDQSIDKEGLFPGGMQWVNASGKSDLHVHTTFGEVHV